MTKNLRIFLSYSWDSEEHKSRVRQFVDRLRLDGLEIIYDGDIEYGDRITKFMEDSVRDSDYVLYICTPGYRKKADERRGGVGYENTVITGELYTKNNERKFIPALFEGDWDISTPYWSTGKIGFDYTDENVVETYNHFVSRLKSHVNQGTIGEITVQSLSESKRGFSNAGAGNGDVGASKKVISKQKLITMIGVVSGLITIMVFLSGKNFPNWFPPSTNQSQDQNQNQNQVELLNAEISKLWEDYPKKSEFIKQLINTGIRRYNSGDYDTAGFYLERAVKEGDEGVTAKNNLAFMIRRNEYTSKTYSLVDLLQPGIDIGDTFSCVNMALYKAAINQWETADAYIQLVSPSAQDLKEAAEWWRNLSLTNDPEGYLALAFLARHQLIEYSFEIADYLEKAENAYGVAPNWMFEVDGVDDSLDINNDEDILLKLINGVETIIPIRAQKVRQVADWIYYLYPTDEINDEKYDEHTALYRWKEGEMEPARVSNVRCDYYDIVGYNVIYLDTTIWDDHGSLYLSRPDGKASILLEDEVFNYQIVNDYIYYSHRCYTVGPGLEYRSLYRTNLDGTERIIAAYEAVGPELYVGYMGFEVRDNYVYNSNHNYSADYRIALGNPATGLERIELINANANNSSDWIVYDTNQIIYAKKDGSEQIVLDSLEDIEGFYWHITEVDDTWVYYADQAGQNYKMRLDGTGKRVEC